MSEFTVAVHYFPGYGGGRLIIEPQHLELVFGSLRRRVSPGGSVQHAGSIVHWIRQRIDWPWINAGPVIVSGETIAVAFVPRWKRSQVIAELERAGFTLRFHSLWSYSRKSLLELVRS